MRIYVLRHGIAEDAGPKTSDFDRELTDEGRAKLERVLQRAKRANVEPEVVISSPLVRAVQTADMAREILQVKSPVQKMKALSPDSSPQAVWGEVRELRSLDSVLLAGHEPLLSHLVAFLLGSPTLHVHLPKAALVAIEMEHFGPQPHGTLHWVLTPKVAS